CEGIAGFEADDPGEDDPTDDDPTEDDKPTDDKPTDDPEIPSDPDGVDIPSNKAEDLLDVDFSADLSALEGFKISGSAISASDFADALRGKVLTLSLVGAATEDVFAAVAQSMVPTKSLIVDVKFYVAEINGTVSVLAAADANGVLFDILTLSKSADGADLSFGADVGGDNKTLATVKTGEWHRVTVWMNVTGDKMAVYLDGACLNSAAALPVTADGPMLSSMTEMRILGVAGSAQSQTIPLSSDKIEVSLDDLSIRTTDTFANAYSSAILTPKVSVSEKENVLSWKTANGALHYTVWRAGEDGVFSVIAEGLKENSYIDAYEGDCSYKVTYSYDSLGIELDSLVPSTSVSAKKSAPEVIVDTVKKLIDLSNPGTLGILVIFGMAMVSVAAVLIVRRFVLKVDDVVPNRRK
ncbi:MAG: hypothetical protein IJY04_01245, partial [Clostridia bacterium]|nr:hypothetical protein [Clostridia bacterium]